MKYSSTLLLAVGFATSISAFALPAPQSGSNCGFSSSLLDCLQPLNDQMDTCRDTDLACTCDTLADLIACYDNHCPGETPELVDTAVEGCNSAGHDVAFPNSDIASATSRAKLGDDEETGSEVEETITKSLVDTESTATETAKVTKTTSKDGEETSAAGGAATSTRRPAAASTTTGAAASQSTGAAGSLAVPAIGGLMAAAIGVIVWL